MTIRWLAAAVLLCACSKSDDASKKPAAAGGSAAAASPEPSRPKPPPPPPPPPPATEPVKVADALEGNAIERVVAIGKDVYWIEATPDGARNSVLRHSSGGGKIAKQDASSYALAVDASYVYFSGGSGPLRRQHHGDPSSEDIASIKYASAIAVDGDAVFISDRSRVDHKDHGKIWRVTNAEPRGLVDAVAIEGLTAAGHRLYFVRDKKEVVSVNADGKDEKVLSDKPGDLYVDDHHVYLVTNTAISRVPLDGGAVEPVIAGSFAVVGGDAARIYVISATDPGVFAIDKKTKAKTLATAEKAMGLAIGADGLYLNEYNKIVRVPLP